MDSTTSRALTLALLMISGVGIAACGASDKPDTSDGGPTKDAALAPDGSGSDSGQTDSGAGDSGLTDSGATDAGLGDAGGLDAARDDAGQLDSGRPDSGTSDAAVDCGAVAPTGKQLVASSAPLVLQGGGITSDGYAFYQDQNSEVLYAVPVAGGAPVNLGPMTSQGGTFRIKGAGALFLPAPANPATGVAPLSSFSAAKGASVIATNAYAYDSYYYSYDVSSDAAYVAYVATSDGVHGALTVTTIDGHSPSVLVPNLDISNVGCTPILQFFNHTLIAQYCITGPGADAAVPPDAGIGSLLVKSFAAPSFAATSIVTLPPPNPNSWGSPPAMSPDGTKLEFVTAAGLELYPVAGGAPTLVDSAGTAGIFTPQGDFIYSTGAGSIIRYGARDGGVGDAGTRVTLSNSGVSFVQKISPNGALLQGGSGNNVDLLSATAPSTPIVAWTTGGESLAGFSADSKFEAIETNFPTNFGIPTFDLLTSPVSGGSATKLLSTAGTFSFTTGSKLVVNTHPNPMTGGADIESFDLNSPAIVSTLVTQADPNFYYLSGSNQVLYTWYCAPTASSGVWTVAAP